MSRNTIIAVVSFGGSVRHCPHCEKYTAISVKGTLYVSESGDITEVFAKDTACPKCGQVFNGTEPTTGYCEYRSIRCKTNDQTIAAVNKLTEVHQIDSKILRESGYNLGVLKAACSFPKDK